MTTLPALATNWIGCWLLPIAVLSPWRPFRLTRPKLSPIDWRLNAMSRSFSMAGSIKITRCTDPIANIRRGVRRKSSPKSSATAARGSQPCSVSNSLRSSHRPGMDGRELPPVVEACRDRRIVAQGPSARCCECGVGSKQCALRSDRVVEPAQVWRASAIHRADRRSFGAAADGSRPRGSHGDFTHHLVQDQASLDFVRDLLNLIATHPNARLVDPAELFFGSQDGLSSVDLTIVRRSPSSPSTTV